MGGTHEKRGRNKGFTDATHIAGQAIRLNTNCVPVMLCSNRSFLPWNGVDDASNSGKLSTSTALYVFTFMTYCNHYLFITLNILSLKQIYCQQMLQYQLPILLFQIKVKPVYFVIFSEPRMRDTGIV